MSKFDELLAREREQTVNDLEGFDRAAALDTGINNSVVNSWAAVHRTYFGKTRAPKRQEQARRRAGALRTPLSKLAAIERILSHVEEGTSKWELRYRLLGIRGRCDRLRRKAKGIVPPKKKAPLKPGVRIGRARGGMQQIIVTAPERDVADTVHAMRQDVDPELPAAPQMLDKLLDILRGDGCVPHAVPQPYVPVPVEEHMKILRDDGEEVILEGPNGSRITGAQYLADYMAGKVVFGLFHPLEGAVNAYRENRFANDKQRALSTMVQPECSRPDCHLPAQLCQVHHVHAWKYGGTTNINNLVPLCAAHNRINDDDPGSAKYGRIEVIYGRPALVTPRGYAIHNQHPHGAMNVLFGHPPREPTLVVG